MIKSLPWAVALAALGVASQTGAQEFAGHCSQCQSTYGAGHGGVTHEACYENHIWPRQYAWPARRAICQAFALQTDHGWRRNNLLGKYDFDPNGEGLSESGRLRVEWILTQSAPHRRTIFVERGADQAETAVRVEAIQTAASTIYPGQGPVDVQETHIRGYGRPAASVDEVFMAFQTNQMQHYPPTLQASGIQAGTSSSGGGQ